MVRIRSTTSSSRRSGTFITSAMASRVMSSWVGPEPTADDDPVAAGQRGAEGQHDPLVVVPHRLVEVGGHADGGQVLPQPLRVGVGDLPEQQLGADRHDLDPHAGQPGRPSAGPAAAGPRPPAARRPSTKYWRPGEHRQERGHPHGRRSGAVQWPASGGARHMPMAMSWTSVLNLAELRAGMEIPWRPATER